MANQTKLAPVNNAINGLADVLQLMDSTHLATLASGKVNLLEVVKAELAKRGLNEKGEWVGYGN